MNITATDRSALIRLASSLPQGSAERKAILAGLKVAGNLPWGPKGLNQKFGVETYNANFGISPERNTFQLSVSTLPVAPEWLDVAAWEGAYKVGTGRTWATVKVPQAYAQTKKEARGGMWVQGGDAGHAEISAFEDPDSGDLYFRIKAGGQRVAFSTRGGKFQMERPW